MKNCSLTPAVKKKANKAADIEEFKGLSAPARRALVGARYTTLKAVAKAKENDLAKLHGFGPNGLKTLKALLAKQGLKLAGA
jgi:hypothetical protein